MTWPLLSSHRELTTQSANEWDASFFALVVGYTNHEEAVYLLVALAIAWPTTIGRHDASVN